MERAAHSLAFVRPWIAFTAVAAVAAVVMSLASCDSSGKPAGDDDKTLTGARVVLVAPVDPPAPLPSVPVDTGPAWSQVDNAGADGWDTEVLASKATERLGVLGKLLVRPEAILTADLEALAAEDFACADLRPATLEVVFQDAILRVERGARAENAAKDASSAPVHRGLVGLAEALNALAAPLRGARDARCEFKVVGVSRAGDSTVTRQLFAMSGLTRDGFLEQTAAWTATWAFDAGGAPPRLRAIEAHGFELVRRATWQPLFTDCTESALGRNPSFREQFLRGFNYWAERIQENRFFALLGTPGLAAGDVNGDELDDLYVCQEGGLPNRLFIHQPDGTAVDASEASGANWIDSSRGALLADLDNDGDQDLAAAVLGSLVLAAGDGRGRFEIQAAFPTSQDTMSLSAADHDSDGDLDLYLCAYKQDDLTQDAGVLSMGASGDFVYHDANNGARNVLFRNDVSKLGEWRFTDVTDEAGLDANNRRFSFAAAWEDFDNDGDQDLYVANDFGRNVLYRNDMPKGGTPIFREIAAEAGAEDSASGMSVSWGDYDRDGWMDLYVGNMFSAAGSRVTGQAMFKPDATGEVRTRLQRFARGNTLLGNRGGKTFDDVSEAAAVTMGRWSWSSSFLDINGDGWEDLIVANGYVTTDDRGDL